MRTPLASLAPCVIKYLKFNNYKDPEAIPECSFITQEVFETKIYRKILKNNVDYVATDSLTTASFSIEDVN